MNFNNYTIKSQEAIQKATELAAGLEQQVVETGHILKATMIADENLISFLFKKTGANKNLTGDKIEEILKMYPKVTGGSPYLSNDAAAALTKATAYLKEFGDEYVAIEHIFLALLAGKDKVADLLKDAGFTEKHLKTAIKELRGGSKVTDQHAEGKYKSLEKYSKNLNEMAKREK